MSGIPWDQPGSDPLADLEAALKLLAAPPMHTPPPLMSPRCGLHDEHAPACRSAICECSCHLAPLLMTDEDRAAVES